MSKIEYTQSHAQSLDDEALTEAVLEQHPQCNLVREIYKRRKAGVWGGEHQTAADEIMVVADEGALDKAHDEGFEAGYAKGLVEGRAAGKVDALAEVIGGSAVTLNQPTVDTSTEQ